ncbi:MAG TPA: ABC transporter permease [Nitrospira sp.]|nr:ABC transporter permease [Nitrospira sp.]
MLRTDHIVVYEADQRARLGWVLSWKAMIDNVMNSRELIWQLFKRDLLAGSKQSVLGLLWMVIAPLVGILSWVLMNEAGVLRPGALGVPYPLYVLFGTAMWGLFMAFYSAAASSLTSAGGLLVQAKFSHEALVAQQMAHTVIVVMVNLVLLMGVWGIFGPTWHWSALLLPFGLIPLCLLGTGIGMMVSVFAVLVRDMTRTVTTMLGLAMFLTPVVYAGDVQSPWLQCLVAWNPLTYLVGGARDVVLEGRIGQPSAYVASVVLAAAVFLAAWRLFFMSEQKVAEKF